MLDQTRVDELLDSLGLSDLEGEFVNGDYVIELNDSSEFSDVYNMISTDTRFNLEAGSIATDDNAIFVFFNDEFEIRVLANFNNDVYEIEIAER